MLHTGYPTLPYLMYSAYRFVWIFNMGIVYTVIHRMVKVFDRVGGLFWFVGDILEFEV